MKAPLVQTSPAMYRINVTPIIDVALVLVIILLVTAPLMTVDVELPGARTRDVRESEKVLVTVDAYGAVAIHEQRVGTERFQGALAKVLRDLESGKEAVVVIRADRGLSHGVVSRVVEQARAAGAARVAIATAPKVVESP